MKVLDLFSGLEGWSLPFKERKHTVFTIDMNPVFKSNLIADMNDIYFENGYLINDKLNWKMKADFDIILASPPCNCFSVASISTHWTGGKKAYIPKDKDATLAIATVKHTLKLINVINPKFWIMENPMGVLRKMPFMQSYNHKLVTYCQYGERRMKPTDLWGIFPSTFVAKKCKNNASCHDRAPRGSKTGTQGIKGKDNRAKIPYALALEICLACEKDMVTE